MKLYFQHASVEMTCVCDVEDYSSVLDQVLIDLKHRNKNYISYYQRTWFDDNHWMWIDVGSHTEFYVVKEE